MLYLANYHLANYHLGNYIVLFYLQQLALNYGLIACGTNVDLKNFPSIRTHLNNLSSEDVSKILLC